jgi:Flp pilus assembly protein TadG
MRPSTTRRKSERGNSMIEFVIAGIAAIGLLISTIQLSLLMWNYHTLAEAVHETNRYIATHGRSCTTGGNACAITVADVVTKFKDNAVGISDTSVVVTLTSQSGTVYTCNPLNSCASDTTQWPPIAHMDNNPGSYTKITASLSLTPAIVALWLGQPGTRITSVTLPATSEVPMVF